MIEGIVDELMTLWMEFEARVAHLWGNHDQVRSQSAAWRRDLGYPP